MITIEDRISNFNIELNKKKDELKNLIVQVNYLELDIRHIESKIRMLTEISNEPTKTITPNPIT